MSSLWGRRFRLPGQAEAPAPQSYGLWIVLALVLLIRVPFWNQAIQGDDTIYLHEASHALIEPLHPDNTQYVFQGGIVDLRGHPHGPMDAWVLAALLAIFGEVREIPFHAAYTIFSLIAAAAMWSLARRYSPNPLGATLLFVVVPVFVVNGNSLETDIPFLAFWLAGVALFESYWPLSCVFLAAAAMTASLPSALLLTPVLGVWVWFFRRHDKIRWAAIFVPPVTLVAWQIFERITGGTLPAQVLGSYLTRFPIFNVSARIALLFHFCFLVSPILVPGTIALAWRKRREPDTLFPVAWIAIFMAGVLAVFFAGSARYLLPIAAPMALLASWLPKRAIAAAFTLQLALGTCLAVANYQHWDAYRRAAAQFHDRAARQRVFVDDEWGLRHYMQAAGAVPLSKAQKLAPGDLIVSSDLSHQVEIHAPIQPVISPIDIRPSMPFRLIGLETASGWSNATQHFLPFDISGSLVDRIRAVEIGERHPTLQYLSMEDPAARAHLVSGIFPDDHWMSGSAIVVLKSPSAATPLRVTFYIPDNSPVRQVKLLLDGNVVAAERYRSPGKYELVTRASLQPEKQNATIEIRVDKTFTAPPDIRELGMVLIGIGFQ